MTPIQIIIVFGILVGVVGVIGYYLYQEAKFKKLVENNFNQATSDAIAESAGFVLEGRQEYAGTSLLDKDIYVSEDEKDTLDDLFTINGNDWNQNPVKSQEAEQKVEAQNVLYKPQEISEPYDLNAKAAPEETEVIPEDSMEAFFVEMDSISFPFVGKANPSLDLVIDMVFEEVQKIKVLPDISQFSAKEFSYYILDKHNKWYKYERYEKYMANAVRLVLPLIDRDGLVSEAQAANIHNELHRFILQHDGHLRCSDYQGALSNIQAQVPNLANIELELGLYLVTKDAVDYKSLTNSFSNWGFVAKDGFLTLSNDGVDMVSIADEHGEQLANGKRYSILSINSVLHKQKNPKLAVDNIFDIAENFMQKYESRILSTNRQLFGQKDYEALMRYLDTYVVNANKKGIELGGGLIDRIF